MKWGIIAKPASYYSWKGCELLVWKRLGLRNSEDRGKSHRVLTVCQALNWGLCMHFLLTVKIIPGSKYHLPYWIAENTGALKRSSKVLNFASDKARIPSGLWVLEEARWPRWRHLDNCGGDTLRCFKRVLRQLLVLLTFRDLLRLGALDRCFFWILLITEQ